MWPNPEETEDLLTFTKEIINPIDDGDGPKRTPTLFYPVAPTNVRISPQNVLVFSFNIFATLL